jgi:hypothetical protein
MTPNDLEEPRIPDAIITKKETVHTYRQTIKPPDQIGMPRLFEALWSVLRKGRFTGHVTVHLNQGGVRDIVTEQRLPEE